MKFLLRSYKNTAFLIWVLLLIFNIKSSHSLEVHLIINGLSLILEGDGTITVDAPAKRRNLPLRVRIVISILNKPANLNMLLEIQKVVGGRVTIERKGTYVTWIASNNEHVMKAFAILAKYPLMTVRKQAQLSFAQNCLIHQDTKLFFETRNMKYDLDQNFKTVVDGDYFKAWLSGFIEAEGNFYCLKYPEGGIKKASFSIGQNNDLAIITKIRDYFNSKHAIIKTEGKHYRISMYGPENRERLRQHFSEYPLKGDKQISYRNWINNFSL